MAERGMSQLVAAAELRVLEKALTDILWFTFSPS
jgi:hypothetical protein